jgi:CheY-like chemotaxis protein
VLVVEDTEDMRRLLATVLSRHGFEVVTAEHGQDALDRLADDPAFGAIVLDIMMPVMDGWAFLEARRAVAALSAIPVVIVSADPTAATRAPSFGVRDVLPKPMMPRELVRIVRSFCSREGG